MTMVSKSAFTITRWEETVNADWEGGKLTRTLATKEFKGDLTGSAVLEAVMLRMAGDEGVMCYVGVERISCTLNERQGSFVITHNAEAVGQERKADWKILPGSGTGQLAGISGHGVITPDHDFILNYQFAN